MKTIDFGKEDTLIIWAEQKIRQLKRILMKTLIIRNHQEVKRDEEMNIIKENRANKKLCNIPKRISRKKSKWRGQE